MDDIGAELVRELKTLRKGRGLFVRQIGERVGPALRRVCAVAEGDGPNDIRTKVAERLKSLASALPEDLGLAVMAAFAIHQDARRPLYQERVRWLADKIGRDERTARRRIDEGIDRLAELATGAATDREVISTRMPSWHTEELHVTVVLDQDPPEWFERRRVVADHDDVPELDLAFTATAPSDQPRHDVQRRLDVDVLYGGTLVRRRKESTDRFGFALALPRKLERGEKHEFALRLRVPEDQVVAPHFVSVPRHRCDVFHLRVRFGLDRRPQRIWRIDAAFQRDIDDPASRGEAIPLDSAGEIHVTFHDLRPGMAYGARWEHL
jgi:hypothetical protein